MHLAKAIRHNKMINCRDIHLAACSVVLDRGFSLSQEGKFEELELVTPQSEFAVYVMWQNHSCIL